MIDYKVGDLFTNKCDAVVNTVNTVGVMGKGIALKFKNKYPKMFNEYKKMCKNGELSIGKLFVYEDEDKTIINFPTKKHWRSNSKIEYIVKGLQEFTRVSQNYNFKSVAFPALGCGNGGLNWAEVKKLIESYLSKLDLKIIVYISPYHYMEELLESQSSYLQELIHVSDKLAKFVPTNYNDLQSVQNEYVSLLEQCYDKNLEMNQRIHENKERLKGKITLQDFF